MRIGTCVSQTPEVLCLKYERICRDGAFPQAPRSAPLLAWSRLLQPLGHTTASQKEPRLHLSRKFGLDYFQTAFLKYFRTASVPLGIMVFVGVPLLSIQTSVWIQPAVPFGQEAPYLPGLCHRNPEMTSLLLIRLLRECALPLSSLRGLQILLPWLCPFITQTVAGWQQRCQLTVVRPFLLPPPVPPHIFSHLWAVTTFP